MDTGDDDCPGQGHSKKLASGFLSPAGRTLTDSWKLREQVAFESFSESDRFNNPFPAPLLPLTFHLLEGFGYREGGVSRPGHSFRIASDKEVTGCREFL